MRHDDKNSGIIESVYVHIPFCVSKCGYCDFFSLPLAEHRVKAERYSDLLLSELASYRDAAFLDPLSSVYFGGGTPSLLPGLCGLIIKLRECLPVSDRTEITVEANPADLSDKLLFDLYRAGVNRLSIGVQSFDDDMLALMGRRHTAKEAETAVKRARDTGFSQISIDLMHSLPNQSLSGWQNTLERACLIDIDHISVYGLSIADNTPWGRMLGSGVIPPLNEDLSAEMMRLSADFLRRQGFERYEVSNYARHGCRSRHNLGYWKRRNYLGLGASASSCIGSGRHKNPDIEYFSMPGARESERLSEAEIKREELYLSLRLPEGIDIRRFNGGGILDAVSRFSAMGMLDFDGRILRLTDKGILFLDEICLSFFD